MSVETAARTYVGSEVGTLRRVLLHRPDAPTSPPPCARALHDVDVAQLRANSFAAGSVGPKVEAACRFVEKTGGLAAIGSLADAAAILRGECGTRVRAAEVTA
jgi:hypothetical protein